MINFILCDDCIGDLERASGIVDDFMMANNWNYKKHLFSDYDDDFLKVISNTMTDKVYILDMELPSRSGIDIARLIRNRDRNSIIIFLTGYKDFGDILLKNDFSFLSFINKFENMEKRLKKSLNEVLKILNKKCEICINESGRVLRFSPQDILYITKDSVERKTVIKTDCNEFKVNFSLASLKNFLNSSFVQTHRCCIINKERVMEYNKRARLIIFDNGESINLVSRDFKGEII